MIVVDVNLLIYAYDSTTPEHAKARAWLEAIFSGQEAVALPWQTIYAFVRILTHPGLPATKLTTQSAVAIVTQWLNLPQVRTLAPSDKHWPLFKENVHNGRRERKAHDRCGVGGADDGARRNPLYQRP